MYLGEPVLGCPCALKWPTFDMKIGTMTLRLSGHFFVFGLVFFLLKSLLMGNCETIDSWKMCMVEFDDRFLIYQTRAILVTQQLAGTRYASGSVLSLQKKILKQRNYKILGQANCNIIKKQLPFTVMPGWKLTVWTQFIMTLWDGPLRTVVWSALRSCWQKFFFFSTTSKRTQRTPNSTWVSYLSKLIYTRNFEFGFCLFLVLW